MGTNGSAKPTRPVPLRAKISPPRLSYFTRERLSDLVDQSQRRRLITVVAPAGFGKTNFLAHAAAAANSPVAWYSVDSSDGDPQRFLAYLHASLAASMGSLPDGWRTAEDAARALETLTSPQLLIIDDLHTIADTPAHAVLETLLTYAPPTLTTMVASRSTPGFDLTRMRVAGDLLEIEANDLRFRSWEVERLFRDFYGEPMPPQDIAHLSRRLEGWAAGLQLFHLATSGRPLGARREVLASFGQRSKPIREYLARNVLKSLPAELREFMLGTCVLGRLSGDLCDRFLERSGSAVHLDEIERRQIFITPLDEDGNYRYHEVLRNHLESTLIEEIGEAKVRERYSRAADLLESEGATAEALLAYSRAGNGAAVVRLVGTQGEGLSEDSGAWIDSVPPALRRTDPWLLLASARQHRAGGRIGAAIDDYRRAEVAFGSSTESTTCRKESIAIAAWQDPLAMPPRDWSGKLRHATVRDPLGARTSEASAPHDLFASGVGALLAGQMSEARSFLEGAAEHPDSSPACVAGARLGAAVAALMMGDPNGTAEAELAAEEAERVGLPWLARLARASLALGTRPDGRSEAAAVRLGSERQEDVWGANLAALLQGWNSIMTGDAPSPVLAAAVDGFRTLRAGTLEAWARSINALALARAGDPQAKPVAAEAEACARLQDVPVAQAIAYHALADTVPDRAAEYKVQAARLLDGTGFVVPQYREPDPHGDASVLSIRCFGGFSMSSAGEPVDLRGIKPRARQALRLLAVHAGHVVHREVLMAALWPDTDIETGMRNLHVTLSSLRHALPVPNGSEGGLILREGVGYGLMLPDGAEIDILEFERAFEEAAVARARGDLPRAIDCYKRALDEYRGELLPEDGPAEWVVEERERRRAEAGEAAQALAELLIDHNEPDRAARACEAGLRIDPYRDDLWRLMISAYRHAGQPAAAARAVQRYEIVLADLGVQVPSFEHDPIDTD